jgi:hypothetical protein
MKTLSFWARRHHFAARMLIVTLLVLLGLLALETALELKNLGLQLPEWPLWFLSLGVVYTIIRYPQGKERLEKREFRIRRLRCDLSLLVSGWVILLLLGNRELPNNHPKQPQAQFIALRTAEQSSGFKRALHDLNPFAPKSNKTHWRAFVRQQLEARRAELAKQKSLTLGKVLLLLLFSTASIIILAYLSCSIACSGSGVLAVLVALGGLVGIVALLCMFLRQTLPDETKGQRLGKALLFLLGGVALTFLLF